MTILVVSGKNKTLRANGTFAVKEHLADTSKIIAKGPVAGLESIVISSGATIDAASQTHLMKHGIPLHFLGGRGWVGATFPRGPVAMETRLSQFGARLDMAQRVRVAKSLLGDKFSAQRVALVRWGAKKADRNALGNQTKRLSRINSIEGLLGLEGRVSALYFQAWSSLIPKPFFFEGRTRRPPKDPVNALMSVAYGFLLREILDAVWTVGLEPHLGYLHSSKGTRPALALDLMEPFRSLAAEDVVLGILRSGTWKPDSGFRRSEDAVLLEGSSWPKFIRAWETRMAAPLGTGKWGDRPTRLAIRERIRWFARWIRDKKPFCKLVSR